MTAADMTAIPALPRRSLSQLLASAPGAAYLLVVMGLLFGVLNPRLFSPENLSNIGLQASVLVIVALGMTLVILTEGIDLSLGPLLGLTGVVFAMLLVRGTPVLVAMAAGMAVGVLAGLINGALISYVGMPAFIVTLGMFGIAQSLSMVLSSGNSITGLPPATRWFNEGVLLGVPVPVWATAATFALTWVLLYRTRFGKYVFAMGGNRRALALSGVEVRRYQVAVYAYAGLLTAFASFIMTARMNSAHPTVAVGLEFDAIAAVILGGTSFEKGRGGLVGTLIGALAVSVLRNGLNLAGVGTEWQVTAVGVVIIAAVGLDSLRRKQ